MALRVPVQALAQLQDALQLVDDDVTRAGLWGDAAVAARAVPRFDLAETFLRQLIAWQGEIGQPREAARSRAQLASLLLATERHGSALTDLEAALDGVADLSSDPSIVELTGQLARARVLVGDDRQALADADRTLEAAQRIGLEAVAVDALTTRGTAQMRLGNEAAGLADLHAAIADAQRWGLIGAELRARNNLAWLVAPDDPHATMKTALEGLELATRMGVGDMGLQLAEVVCTAAIDTGEWDLALGVLDDVRDRPLAPAHRLEFAASEAIVRALQGEPGAGASLDALEPFDAETDRQILAGVDQARAWIAFVDGRMDDARRLAAAAAVESIGAEQHAALVLATHADLWLGDTDAAAARIDRLREMGRHGRAVDASETTLRAGAAALAGDDSARDLYETAIASWRTLRLPLHLALCLAERGRFIAAVAGAVPDAGADEVADVLTDLGAAGMLQLLRPDASIGSHASRS
jgi:tetratricopeptide (TPR) repeat protein